MTAVEVSVTSIAAGGDGVARHEGRVLFVPRTAPGDRVLVEYQPTGRFAHAALVRVLEASPQRVEPPCRHYTDDRCGGCQLQHLEYGMQLEAKRGIVRDALERIAKRSAPLGAPRPSPAQWRYRRKLTLALRRAGTRWVAGLHPFDRPGDVFPLDDCPITEVGVLGLWRDVMRASADLPESRELRVAVTMAGGDSSLVVEGGSRWPTHERFFNALSAIGSLWWHPDSGTMRMLHAKQGVEAGASFTQVNASLAADLQRHVVDRVCARDPLTAIDAYAGTGDVAAQLGQRGIRVTAIELDPPAAALAARRLPPSSRAITGAVEDLLPSALPADVVVVNPPRVGLHADVCAALEGAAVKPRGVVYVSCNPATLARDLGRLPSYRIVAVDLFDMFPQTAHVETVCELEPIT